MTGNDEVECPTCGGEGSFETWANPGCAPGEERWSVKKCACCNGSGAVSPDETHDEDGSCCIPDPPERDDPDD